MIFFINQYFLQKDGINNTNTANNSNLPKIMAILKIHLEKSVNCEKLPFGPIISPRPGPTFDIEVAAADMAVVKFNPSIDNKAETIKKINIYKNINEIIEAKNFSSILFLSYFMLNIPLG
tara:strand:+ start:240 stop:599 length:360 start_codon:yes stop_codon:yes gene_type:complete